MTQKAMFASTGQILEQLLGTCSVLGTKNAMANKPVGFLYGAYSLGEDE